MVETHAKKLKEAADAKRPDYSLTLMVNQLIQTVKTWDPSTQPIEANGAVAIVVRNIALHLWNKHQKLDYAIQITNALIEIFKGVIGMGEINRKLNEDKKALDDIEEQRKRQREEERRKHQRESVEIPSWFWKLIFLGIMLLIGALSQNC